MGKLIVLKGGHQVITENMKAEAMRLWKEGWLTYTLVDGALGEQVAPEEIDTEKDYIALWPMSGG